MIIQRSRDHHSTLSGTLTRVMTEVRRGYRSPIPEGKFITRTWTHAPPESHTIRYEGIIHGYRGMVTRVHNPKTGFFEIKRSPVPSPTVSPVRGLHGATSDIKPSLAQARTAIKHKQSTETPHLSSSTYSKHRPKTSQITGSTYKCKPKVLYGSDSLGKAIRVWNSNERTLEEIGARMRQLQKDIQLMKSAIKRREADDKTGKSSTVKERVITPEALAERLRQRRRQAMQSRPIATEQKDSSDSEDDQNQPGTSAATAKKHKRNQQFMFVENRKPPEAEDSGTSEEKTNLKK